MTAEGRLEQFKESTLKIHQSFLDKFVEEEKMLDEDPYQY